MYMCIHVILLEPNHVLLPKQARITMSKQHTNKHMVPKPCTTFNIYSFKKNVPKCS